MYIQYRDLKLIKTSGRPDVDNESILNGDYLDKSQECFIMPSKDEMMKFIFSDWQKGDILVIADYPLQHPKKQGDTLVEMTREEICQSGDLSILNDGEYFDGTKIIMVEYNQEYLKPIWDRNARQWIEGATLEEQLEFYKQEILKTTAELSVYEKVGFTDEELQKKLNKLTQKHNEVAFEIANGENSKF